MWYGFGFNYHGGPWGQHKELLVPKQQFLSRRFILSSILVGSALEISIPSYAAAPTDAGEAIRRSAAAIPGFGPTDVFFPASLLGSWKMTREVELNGRSEKISLAYPFRFIRSIEEDSVVADRGVNQAELEMALMKAVLGKDDVPTLRSYEWEVSNPNDLRLIMSDGSKKEIKVTKRAFERTDDYVSSSEFQRVTQESASTGIPNLSARRVLTKWKIIDESRVEGMEIVYSMGGGDPLAGATGLTEPNVLSKSKLVLVR